MSKSSIAKLLGLGALEVGLIVAPFIRMNGFDPVLSRAWWNTQGEKSEVSQTEWQIVREKAKTRENVIDAVILIFACGNGAVMCVILRNAGKPNERGQEHNL